MENKLLGSKLFLYVTEFFAGVSVMAVELGASRLMAPYFSSSQIVWTVIIGVIMIAMAIGNLWGGKLADKTNSPDKLYGRILIAAIWIALIPFVGRWLIAGVSLLLAMFVTKNFLVWAALAACLVIFAFPCVLLGTVTPSLTKFTVDNLDDTGKTVGKLNALNTIGSIIGTFVPTFITIPAVGTAATFLIFAGVLAAIGIVYFAFARKKMLKGIVAAVEDGRAYLTASEKQFDVIMVDAYQDITIPFQLSSVEFFTEVQRHLKPGGVMVVNLNMTSAQDGSINQYLCDTMSSVFAHTYTVNVPANTNTVVFCSDSDDLRQTFDENRVLLQNTSYAAMMETVARDLRDYTGGDHILTDDKAPVELLGMRVLDELIDGQLSYYKEQFSMEEIINMVT